MCIISEIQCRTLAFRPRLKLAASSAKTRKYVAPALPAALRQMAKARKAAVATAADELQPLGGLASFACLQAREELPVAVAAGMVLGACGRPPEGCHHLQEAVDPPRMGQVEETNEWSTAVHNAGFQVRHSRPQQ